MSPFRPLLVNADSKCPICGRPVMDKKCLLCNQVFYAEDELPIIEKDVVYISITTFVGWVGMRYSYHLAFNLATKEYAGVKVFRNNEERTIQLSNDLIRLLTEEQSIKDLFHVDLPSHNGTKFDNNIFYVNVQRGEKIFRIAVDDDCLCDWPIFDKIVKELDNKI